MSKLFKIEVNKAEENKGDFANYNVGLEIEDGSGSCDVMGGLACAVAAVFENLQMYFNFSPEDTVKGFAGLVINLLENGDEEDAEEQSGEDNKKTES